MVECHVGYKRSGALTSSETPCQKHSAQRMTWSASCLCAVSSEQIDAPLLPPEPMAEPKSVRLGFVTGLVAVDKLQVRIFRLDTRTLCAPRSCQPTQSRILSAASRDLNCMAFCICGTPAALMLVQSAVITSFLWLLCCGMWVWLHLMCKWCGTILHGTIVT